MNHAVIKELLDDARHRVRSSLKVSMGIVHESAHNFDMKFENATSVVVRWVPHYLTTDKVEILQTYVNRHEN